MAFLAELMAVGAAQGYWAHRLRADDLTTPAAVEAWAEWTPTHQWMAEHGRKEMKTDA